VEETVLAERLRCAGVVSKLWLRLHPLVGRGWVAAALAPEEEEILWERVWVRRRCLLRAWETEAQVLGMVRLGQVLQVLLVRHKVRESVAAGWEQLQVRAVAQKLWLVWAQFRWREMLVVDRAQHPLSVPRFHRPHKSPICRLGKHKLYLCE